MAILKIARMGHPVLASVAQPVALPVAPEVRRLLADMHDTLEDSGGIGLAAPQVHVPLRLILYRVPAARNEGQAIPLRVLINPVLEPIEPATTQPEGMPEEAPAGDTADDTVDDWEACLSLPGLTGRVPRHARVRWHTVTLDGTPLDGEASGFHARVLQHECDHLDGILYPQRMTDLSAFGFVEEVKARLAASASPRIAPDCPGLPSNPNERCIPRHRHTGTKP